jgi:hypothetical protein
MDIQKKKAEIEAKQQEAANKITQLQAFIYQCNGQLIILNELEKEKAETTEEPETTSDYGG